MQSNEIKISYFKHPIYKDYASDENGNVFSLKFGKIRLINPFENKFGYLQIIICNCGKKKLYYVHRFVFECLNNKIIENGFEIDHIDKNKKNNRFSNLREVSKLTNNLNRYNNEEIDELPEDAIEIEKYNDHLFENLYFSPSNNCLYKSSEEFKFKIPFKSRNRLFVQNINGNTVSFYLNVLRKNLGFKN